MLTTEVVKGLINGKVYKRKGDVLCGQDNFIEIKMDYHIWKRQTVEMKWYTASFTINDLRADWEEVTEWEEITWQEAVECDEKNIPLQWFSDIDSEWVDKQQQFESCCLGFIRDHKWRKKVEEKDE